MRTTPGLLILTSLVTSGLCAVYQQLSDLTQDRFDFVVVGGGAAGAVLASRLSEVPDFQVLVIEAGPSNEGVLLSDVPFFAFDIQHTPYDWNFTTTPQEFAKGRRVPYPRGHILGGSSAINLMVYTRGSVDDYDRWARVTGDSGWSWNEVFPYFIKNERFIQPTDGRNITGEYNPAIHGYNGMTQITVPNQIQSKFDERCFNAADELHGNFEFTLDMNNGTLLGTGWAQGTNGGGSRSSSATSYLTTGIMGRTNVHVLMNTRATRILRSNTSSSDGPEFDSVEIFGNDNTPGLVQASKEVILSAGAVGSPHILFHSGFGDAQELQSVGIKPLVNLPSLGKNLTDHPFILVDFAAENTEPNVLANDTLLAEALDEWKQSKTGPLSDIPTNNLVWGRLPADSPFGDPGPGRNAPHWELILALNLGHSPAPHVTAAISIVSPTSRGTLTIGSSDPFDPPIIDPAFFTTDVDREIGRDSVRNARKFFGAKAWEGYVVSETGASAGAESDDALDDFISSNFTTTWHAASTAKMSPEGADYGVVNPDLKVKGVQGLRIVDASVMPFLINGHPLAGVYVLAERAADMIKRDWAAPGQLNRQGKCSGGSQ